MRHDLTYALRMLKRRPIVTAVSVLSLAVGLAGSLTVFSWLDAFVYRPLSAVPDQSTLVVVDGISTSGDSQRLAYPEYRELRSKLSGVHGLLAYTYQPFTLATGDHAERVWGQLVSGNFFDVLQVQPATGRGFRSSEEERGLGAVAVISDRLWKQRFDRSPQAVGSTIRVNGVPLTVIGVAPQKFAGVTVGLLLDLWIPVGMQPQLSGGAADRLDSDGVKWLGAYARLRAGTSVAAVREEVRAIGLRLSAQARERAAIGATFTATTLADAPWGGTTVLRPVLMIVSLVLGFVLVVTCANVASLLIARGIERRSEIALRMAMGAAPRRLLRQLLVEGGAIALLASGLAVGTGLASAQLFQALLPPSGFPIGFSFAVSGRWLAVATTLGAVAALVFGCAPAFALQSTSVGDVLREHSSRVQRGQRGWTNAVLGIQIALSVALASAGLLLARSLSFAAAVNPGFDTSHGLLAAVDLSQAGMTPSSGRAIVSEILESIALTPGVRSVSAARRLPLNFGGRGLVQARVPGYVAAPNEDVALALNQVAPRYFDTMAIAVIAGREFTDADNESAESVAIVNQSAARQYWPGHGALDSEIFINNERLRIVGVVADIRQDDLTSAVAPAMWRPVAQDYRPDLVLHIAAHADPGRLAAQVRRAVAAVAPQLALHDIRTMSEHLQIPIFPFRLATLITMSFSAIGLLLSGLGLYAAVTRSVSQRRSELAVRMALGATRGAVATTVLQSTARVVGTAIVAGSALSFALSQAITAALPGIAAGDPMPYLASFGLMSCVAGVAVAVPTIRALSVRPGAVLR
jgi:predicted permease